MQHKNQTLYLPSSRTPGFLNSGTLTLQGARLQHTLEIQTEQGAAQRLQSVTWAESSSGPAVPTGWHASSQLGDTTGPSPILSWQQLPSTQNTGTGTSTVVIMWAAALRLPELLFQPGDTKAKASTLTKILFNQQKTTRKMEALHWCEYSCPR